MVCVLFSMDLLMQNVRVESIIAYLIGVSPQLDSKWIVVWFANV